MPWIFIPDGQAFHFIMVYQELDVKGMWKEVTRIWCNPDDKLIFSTCEMLIPKPDLNFIKGEHAGLDVVYVRHNRDKDPKEKSKVNDFEKYIEYDDDLSKLWDKLMNFPWLRTYVEFGRTALIQLKTKRWDEDAENVGISWNGSKKVKEKRGKTLPEKKMKKKLNKMKVWLKKQWGMLIKEGKVAKRERLS